jgi:hypothetical protein
MHDRAGTRQRANPEATPAPRTKQAMSKEQLAKELHELPS